MNQRWPILAIFVLSGAAGLVYEVVWARQLVLVFGNTTQAVSAILTGFFGGMAIGSVWGGRVGDRVSRPLRLYGVLELILVVVVLATPLTFRLIHEVYRAAFSPLESSRGVLSLIRFGLSLIALGPATILMGATLPALTRYLTRDPTRLSEAFGRLYAANTIGAIIGTVVAGFFLIELFGLQGTVAVGAGCSAVAGIVALILDHARGAVPTHSASERSRLRAGAVSDRQQEGRLRLALAVSFASGLTSLGYQMLWMRLLASGTGNSTYIFTTILAVFLIGLAGGALAFSWFRARIGDTVGFLAQGQLTIAMLAVLPTVLWTLWGLAGFIDVATRFQTLFSHFLLPATVVVLPATFFMGLTFPATSALVADERGQVSTNTGLLLSANTLGAITGTFSVPFVLIPAFGSPVSLALLALTNLAVATMLAAAGGIRAKRTRLVTAVVSGVVAVSIVAALATRRVFVDPARHSIEAWGGEVFDSREDEIASVHAGLFVHKQLWVTGVSMTVLTVDAKLMPIMALMLRPASRSALTVAVGMGSSFRTALNAGLTTDAVELVPSVPSMFRWFYPDAALVLANPNGRVIISDGRNHVELTKRKYDIIITDPPPPIESSGSSVISSFEYYIASKARLTSGGVMMQWVPQGHTLPELKAHIRTFRRVFRNVTIAIGPGGFGFFMLGSDSPIPLTTAAIEAILARPRVVEDLSSALDSPVSTREDWARIIPKLVWISGDEVGAFAGDGPLITDDRPLSEYFLLRHRSQPNALPTVDALLRITGKRPTDAEQASLLRVRSP